MLFCPNSRGNGYHSGVQGQWTVNAVNEDQGMQDSVSNLSNGTNRYFTFIVVSDD